jgi:hypothetical protein
MAVGPGQLTTYTIITTGVETIVVPALAGSWNDLVIVTVCNTSNKDVRVDFRDTFGGPIIFSIWAPGNTMGSFNIPGATLQSHTQGGDWTATSVSQTIDIRVFCVYDTHN